MSTSYNHYFTVEKIIQFLNEHRRQQLSLDDISQHIGMSKFHLQRLFHEWAGISSKQFLQYLTLEHCKQLLLLGANTLNTAYGVGLSVNGRLHDLFVKFEAISPGAFKKQGQGVTIKWQSVATVFGETLIAETSEGICKVLFGHCQDDLFKQIAADFPQAEFSASLGKNAARLAKYLNDWQIPKDNIRLALKGSPFQCQVWRALLKIPAGQLVAYQDIARLIERPKATRAVATAIANNPITYLIPCHRVIRNNGLMGNYLWGSARKQAIHVFEVARLT